MGPHLSRAPAKTFTSTFNFSLLFKAPICLYLARLVSSSVSSLHLGMGDQIHGENAHHQRAAVVSQDIRRAPCKLTPMKPCFG